MSTLMANIENLSGAWFSFSVQSMLFIVWTVVALAMFTFWLWRQVRFNRSLKHCNRLKELESQTNGIPVFTGPQIDTLLLKGYDIL